MLYIDEHSRTAPLLALSDNMQCHGGLTAAFRSIDLDDASLGHTADPQCDIQRQAAGGNCLHIQGGVLTKTHDRTLAELLFNLSQRSIQCLLLLRSYRCVFIFRLLNSHIKTSVFAKTSVCCPGQPSHSRKNAAFLPAGLPWKRAHELTISHYTVLRTQNQPPGRFFLGFCEYLFSTFSEISV